MMRRTFCLAVPKRPVRSQQPADRHIGKDARNFPHPGTTTWVTRRLRVTQMIAVHEAWRAGLFRPERWLPNLVSGVIVGIVAPPLAMAFAIASGAKPEQGLDTAIVAGFLELGRHFVSFIEGGRT
jgi:hypothetical protein